MAGDITIKEQMCLDPLAIAEKITKKSYKEDKATGWMGLALQIEKNKQLQQTLSFNRDVYSNMPLNEYIATIKRWGFEEVLYLDIPSTEYDSGNKYRIFWCDGLLLSFDSYSGDKIVNSGHLLFQLHINENVDWSVFPKCSHSPISETYVAGSIDCREGLANKLAGAAACGTFLQKWKLKEFMWLLHYQDTKVKGYDYNKINAERVAMLPQHVRDAITIQ